MARKLAPQSYLLTFSTSRLVKLLRDAGFDIDIPADLAGALVRFVSCPSEDDVHIEACHGRGQPWVVLQAPEREVETIRPGQYL